MGTYNTRVTQEQIDAMKPGIASHLDSKSREEFIDHQAEVLATMQSHIQWLYSTFVHPELSEDGPKTD